MGIVHAIHPSKWEVQHAASLRAGAAYINEHHELPPGLIWGKLDYRHELNPARFRYFHPFTSSILDKLDDFRSEPPTHFPEFPPYVPPTTGSQVTPDCPVQSVAEPGSVISLMIGVVMLAAWSIGRVGDGKTGS